MCRTYRKDGREWTRFCYRTGAAGTRLAGDRRGRNGHVAPTRRPARGTPKGKPRLCRLCGAPHRPLDASGRCPECRLEIARGERPDDQPRHGCRQDPPRPRGWRGDRRGGTR